MKIIAMMILGMSLLIGSVDINNADKNELMNMKGVGAVKAQSIIEFRKSHCFKTVTELTLVKGIGKKTVAKNDLTAGKCNK
jgi:competence protein ComEA